MAWVQWRESSDGQRLASVHWRDETGAMRSKAIPTSDPQLVEMHLHQAARLEGEQDPSVRPAEDPLDLLDQFLEEKALAVRPATISLYRQKLQHLFVCWADREMSTWTRRMFVQYVKAQGWSPRSLEIAIGCCRRFIRWAHEVNVPVPDFIGSIKGPPVHAPERSPLTRQQISRLLNVVRGHRLEVPVALAALAGLSQSDLYALTWDEVDLAAGLITRRRQKTGVRLRIPITSTLEEVLRRHHAPRGPVCRSLPKTRGSALRSLHRLFAKAGIPQAPRGQNGWHRFRHSIGTDLGRTSDVSTTGFVLGHARDSTITLRYMHTDDDRARAALEARDREIRALQERDKDAGESAG